MNHSNPLARYYDYLAVCFRMSIFRSLEYRWGVLIQYLLDIIWYIVQFALLRTAFQYVPQLGSYTLAEAYFFLAFLFTNDAMNMTLFNGGVRHFAESIRKGGLDYYLLKPMPTLYQLTVARVNLSGLLNVGVTIGFWVYALTAFDVSYPAERWFWAILMFINGSLINITMRLIIGCCAFWTTQADSLNWLFHELMRFGTKPENVYSAPLRRFLSTALPALLLSAWPCLMLIRETSPWEKGYPFLVSAASLGVLVAIWRVGVRRYEGLSFQG